MERMATRLLSRKLEAFSLVKVTSRERGSKLSLMPSLNKLRRTRPVMLDNRLLELITHQEPWGWLVKYSTVTVVGGYKPALLIELAERGITDIIHPEDHEKPEKAGKPMTFTEIKDLLKLHEMARVKAEFPDDKNAQEHSKRSFKPLSEAAFEVSKE